MFTNTNSNSILAAIRANRAEKAPIAIDRKVAAQVAYRESVETLLNAASRLAASAIESHEDPRRAEFVASVAKAFRSVLVVLGEHDYQVTPSDVDAVVAFVGSFRTVDGLRTFVPAGVKTFRNSFEKFVAIRANAEMVRDAETIKADKKAARKARKEAKKAAAAIPALVSGAPALSSAVIESVAVEIA